METGVKLTKLASCAGCGAKVGAGTLASMLEGFRTHKDPRALKTGKIAEGPRVALTESGKALRERPR